jgi:hypothetical protein
MAGADTCDRVREGGRKGGRVRSKHAWGRGRWSAAPPSRPYIVGVGSRTPPPVSPASATPPVAAESGDAIHKRPGFHHATAVHQDWQGIKGFLVCHMTVISRMPYACIQPMPPLAWRLLRQAYPLIPVSFDFVPAPWAACDDGGWPAIRYSTACSAALVVGCNSHCRLCELVEEHVAPSLLSGAPKFDINATRCDSCNAAIGFVLFKVRQVLRRRQGQCAWHRSDKAGADRRAMQGCSVPPLHCCHPTCHTPPLHNPTHPETQDHYGRFFCPRHKHSGKGTLSVSFYKGIASTSDPVRLCKVLIDTVPPTLEVTAAPIDKASARRGMQADASIDGAAQHAWRGFMFPLTLLVKSPPSHPFTSARE